MSRIAEERAADLLREVPHDWDAVRVERSLQGVSRRRRRRRLRTGAVAACASVLLAVGFVVARGGADVGGSALTLADGSTIVPIGPADVKVDDVSPRHVNVVLQQGHVDLDVTHRPEREFVVLAGAVRVTVLGTHFDVQRDGETVRVRVSRGLVRVSWGDGQVKDLPVGADEVFPAAEAALPIEATPSPAPPSPATPSPAPPAVPRPRSAGASSWRALAEEGAYAEAYALIRANDADAVRDVVDDLLLAADAARLSGHASEALPFLERIVANHATDSRAPVAAFSAGRVLLTVARLPEAAAAFEKAVDLGAEEPLRENAVARAVETYALAGDTSRAARLAQAYLQRYPAGRWATAMQVYAAPGR